MITWSVAAVPSYAQYTFTETYSSLFVRTLQFEDGAGGSTKLTTRKTFRSAATRGLTADTIQNDESGSYDALFTATNGTSQTQGSTGATGTGASGTFTTTAPVTGIQTLTSGGGSSFTDFTATNNVVPKTSSHLVTTTQVGQSVATVLTTSQFTTTANGWTTVELYDSEADTTYKTFTQTTVTQNTTTTADSIWHYNEIVFTTNGTSTNIGLWDTIYKPQKHRDFQEQHWWFEKEALLAVNQTYFADTWDGIDINANGKIATYDELTIKAFVTTQDVFVLGYDNNQTYQFSTSWQNPITFHAAFNERDGAESDYTVEESVTTVANYRSIPNTTSVARDVFSTKPRIVTTSLQQSGDLNLNHYGNIQTFFAWVGYVTTITEVQADGNTLSFANNVSISKVSSAVLKTTYTTQGGSNFLQSGGGNTSISEYRQLLGVIAERPIPPGVETRYPYIYDRFPRCSIVKSYGAFLDGQFGYRITADTEEPPISENVMAQLSRAIATTADVFTGDENARFYTVTNYYENADVSTSGRAIYSLIETATPAFTIDGKTITWTTTTETNETTEETTQSLALGLEGDPRVGVVAVKTVLGGKVESYATFYNYLPRGLYLDSNNNLYTGNGEVTLQTGDGDTSAYAKVPFLTVVSVLGGEPMQDGSPQVTTIARNQVPRGAGEFAYNWTNIQELYRQE